MAFLQKLMNIFTGDLYSMYAYIVLQGIGSPSCMIIKYEIPFGEQQSWMSEVRKLNHFNKKTGPPKWSISFQIVLKKRVFQAHRRVPPTTGVVELWNKNYVAMKTNGIRWHSFQKLMNIFTGGLYSMYVVLQGIGSPSCIIIKYVIPFG